jgi:hypothetical protein
VTHVPVQLPFKGFTEQAQFSAVPPGMTPSCVNVMPSDVFNGRMRISTRNATRLFSLGDVQFLSTYRIYESNKLVEKLIFVRGGKVYYADSNDDLATVTVTLFGSGTGAGQTQNTPFLNTTGLVEGVQFNDHFYFVDGDHYVIVHLHDPGHANAVQVWGSASPSKGPFHTDPTTVTAGCRARLICRWGARLVLAGYRDTPNIWYACSPDNAYVPSGAGHASASHDGWDAAEYIGAISGTSGNEYGTLTDPIVAIFPFAQSGLMFACSNSFAFLTGDPVFDTADVQLVNLTKSMGIAGQRAFCQSQEKGAFILARDGLYFINANDFNFNRGNRVSAGRLDSFFLRLDFGNPSIGGTGPLSGGTLRSMATADGGGAGAATSILENGSLSAGTNEDAVDIGNTVAAFTGTLVTGDVFPCLCYDPDREGIWMFLPVNGIGQSSLHVYYDLKTDSFWPQRFHDPNAWNPTSAVYIGTTRTKYGRLFMGGSSAINIIERSVPLGVDGWDEEMDEATQRSQLIRSSLTFGPIIGQLPYRIMLNEARVDLGDDVYETPTGFTDLSVDPILTVSTGDTAQSALGIQVDSLFVTNINPLIVDGTFALQLGTIEVYDGETAATPTPNRIDGRFAIRPFGEYTQSNPFSAGTERVYTGPGDWLLRYDSSSPGGAAWTIERIVSTGPTTYEIEYYQVVGDIGSPNGSMITNQQVPLLTESKDYASVSGASFPEATVTEIGSLVPGRNEAIKSRIRAEAMYLTLASDGRPWSVERMSVVVSQVGKSRGGA